MKVVQSGRLPTSGGTMVGDINLDTGVELTIENAGGTPLTLLKVPGSGRATFGDLTTDALLQADGVVTETDGSNEFSLVSRRHNNIVILGADFTKNNDTTLETITGFSAALAVGENRRVEACLHFNASVAAGLKIAFALPTGAILVGAVSHLNQSDTLVGKWIEDTTAEQMGGAATAALLTIRGVVVNGANAGNIELQAAQNAAQVEDTDVLEGSWYKTETVS